MEESVKYFVPDISDIRVGYECEIKSNHGYESFNKGQEHWHPIKISFKDENSTYTTSDITDILIGLDDGYQPVRVPYLTKEQIEAEGWEWRDNKPFDRSFFVKGNYFLVFYKDYTVEIVMADVLKNDYLAHTSNGRMFAGQIKDINTFRYICKLLGI